MEIWDLYTADRKRTGITHIRGEEIPEGLYHPVVHAWIRNSEGEYLISQRSASRPTFPLMWECVGGSVLAGETSLEGALREAEEEVGIKLDSARGKLLFSKVRSIIDGKRFNDILDVWLFQYDGDIALANATTDEVAQAKWMNRREIEALNRSGDLVATLRYFFDKVDIQ